MSTRVPGHEVVGLIDAVGSDVPEWKTGARVGGAAVSLASAIVRAGA